MKKATSIRVEDEDEGERLRDRFNCVNAFELVGRPPKATWRNRTSTTRGR